jgi:hypothetical protein
MSNTVHIDTGTARLTTQPFPDVGLLERCGKYAGPRLRCGVKFMLYGAECTMRRGQVLLGPEGLKYTFAGATFQAEPLNKDAQQLLTAVNLIFPGLDANAILVNKYANGAEYISQHSDAEDGLTPGGSVVTISLGAQRALRIKDKQTGKTCKDIPLKSGEVLCMSGDFQQKFTHGIPKQLRVKDPRWSFTFRSHRVGNNPAHNKNGRAKRLTPKGAPARLGAAMKNTVRD